MSVTDSVDNPRHKILVVDDEPHIIRIIKLSLEKAGYEVISANSGEDGIEKVKQEHPELVILDVMMPSMDGFAVCQHIRKLDGFGKVPILFLTARGQSDDLEYARSIGANDLMTKPFGPRQLIDLVGHHLARANSGGQDDSQQGGGDGH